MRGMTDSEFRNFHDHVKCDWLSCCGGMGLAGHGLCSFKGEWKKKKCPLYRTEEECKKKEMDILLKSDFLRSSWRSV